MGTKRESFGRRRRAGLIGSLLAVAFVVMLASVASAHDVTGVEVDCSKATVHFDDFPTQAVVVHIVVHVAFVSTSMDFNVDVNVHEAVVPLTGVTFNMKGHTSLVLVDATWTNYGDQHVHAETHITCGTKPPPTTTSTTMKPTTTTKSSTTTSSSTTSTTVKGTVVGTQIFQVEFRDCHVLHVGYQRIPAGTVVHWQVSQGGEEVATSQFIAVAGDGFHFLSQDIGKRFTVEPRKAHVHFWWEQRGVSYVYDASRYTECVAPPT